VPHRADRPEFGLSSAKPQQWFSFDLALAAFRKNPAMFAGIGYVVTGAHGVVGTDLDHCVKNGIVAP
jgi:primase-polymerase (primpol)-like protein